MQLCNVRRKGGALPSYRKDDSIPYFLLRNSCINWPAEVMPDLVSHSQTVTTHHPKDCNRRVALASRRLFPRIFVRQNAGRELGNEAFLHLA